MTGRQKCRKEHNKTPNTKDRPTENIHNFSLYALLEEDKEAFSFSLDESIPKKLNENKILYKSNSNHFTGNFFNIKNI